MDDRREISIVNNIALPVLWDALLHSKQATNNILAGIRATLAQMELPVGYRLLEIMSIYKGPPGLPQMGNEQFVFCVPENLEFPEFNLWHTDKIHAHGDLHMLPPNCCFKLVLARGEWYMFDYDTEYPPEGFISPTELKAQPTVDTKQPVQLDENQADNIKLDDIIKSTDDNKTDGWKPPKWD